MSNNFLAVFLNLFWACKRFRYQSQSIFYTKELLKQKLIAQEAQM